MPRTPDEILLDFGILEQCAYGQSNIDVRGLLWEVIEDLLDSLGRYSSWAYVNTTPSGVVAECKAMLTDYAVNNYGDD